MIPCPYSRLRIWSPETGSAVSSRFSLLILHTQAKSGTCSRDSFQFSRRRCDGRRENRNINSFKTSLIFESRPRLTKTTTVTKSLAHLFLPPDQIDQIERGSRLRHEMLIIPLIVQYNQSLVKYMPFPESTLVYLQILRIFVFQILGDFFTTLLPPPHATQIASDFLRTLFFPHVI